MTLILFFFWVTGKMSTLCQLTPKKIPDQPKLCEMTLIGDADRIRAD